MLSRYTIILHVRVKVFNKFMRKRKIYCREKVSLNQMANDSTFKIIQRVLDLGVKLTEVFVDTVGGASCRYRCK